MILIMYSRSGFWNVNSHLRKTLGPAEIYRNKLEQCVADGTLDDEDVKNLLRLRVLLCVPQEVVDSAHAEICGRIFSKVYLPVAVNCLKLS